MQTTSVALTANTPAVLLTGRYVIRQVQYSTSATGTLKVYDASAASLTQSNPEYDTRTVTSPYTRTNVALDVRDASLTYNYEGISTADDTVAADASADLTPEVTIVNADAGITTVETAVDCGRGVMANSTVNATIVIQYQALP